MNKEEKEAIDFLRVSAITKIEKTILLKEDVKCLLNLIDKQEKIIDSLAQWVSNLSPMVDKQAVKDIIYKENKYE